MSESRHESFLSLSGISASFSQPCSSKPSSFFANVKLAPPDEIFNTSAAFQADTSSTKVNLGIGAYRTEEGKPYILEVVKEAERRITNDTSLNKEYLTIAGMQDFIVAAQKLIMGKFYSDRVTGIQSLSGTGALRVLMEFLAKTMPGSFVYVSRPTWGPHHQVVEEAGLSIRTYSYWNPATRGLDIDGFLADLSNAPRGSIFLLHACAHNPTGVDPTPEQWQSILRVMQSRNLFPFFDSAYQGFASGDLDRDAYPVRLFAEAGMEMVIAQSFAKNLGLYGERVGCGSVVCRTSAIASLVKSQLQTVVRPMYSNPPLHGVRIAKTILTDPQLFQQWKQELLTMSGRIKQMRKLLQDELTRLKTPSTSGDWSHITSQIGMFSFTGLTPTQVDKVTSRHHVYMLRSGRISMAGLNTRNVRYVAEAFDDAIRN